MTDIDATKIRGLDFTLLLIFQALVRHRRTTDAARQLGLSQSAISHALARLRALFDDPLFLRRPHGLEPTRHALELAPRVEAMLAEARTALGLAGAFDPAATARGFRVGAPDFLATLLSAPLLESMQAEAPSVRLAMRIALGQDALRALERDEIDLAVGRFPRLSDSFAVRRLYDDRYCVVARADHPALAGGLTRRLYETLDHVAVSLTGDFRTLTEEDIRDLGLARSIVATAPRFTIAFDMVARSELIALGPGRLAEAYAARFGLTLHELPFRWPPLRVVTVTRPRPDPGVVWLAGRLEAAVAA